MRPHRVAGGGACLLLAILLFTVPAAALDTLYLVRSGRLGVFRKNVDPIDLYISISALTAHYISNHHTFEALFGQRLMAPQRIKQRLEHAAEMVERYLVAKRP